MNSNRLFLLGGGDREMDEIREVLVRNGEKFCDKSLSWGAKLSDYRDIIEHLYPSNLSAVEEREYYANSDLPIIYAIELTVDDPILAKNVQIIDHHNELAANPPSLIQVLNILGLQPTELQKRIGWVDAMGWRGLLLNTTMTVDEIKNFIGVNLYDPEFVDGIEHAWAFRRIWGEWSILELPHSKTVMACNVLIGRYDKIAFICPDEIGIYDCPETAKQLQTMFGGWSGGAGLFVPELKSSFWGLATSDPKIIQQFKNFIETK